MLSLFQKHFGIIASIHPYSVDKIHASRIDGNCKTNYKKATLSKFRLSTTD